MKHLLPFVILVIVATVSLPQQPSFAAADDEQGTIEVSLCELVNQPQRYDGRRVKGTATYTIGVHAAVLYATCNDMTKTVGLKLAPSCNSNSRSHKALVSRAQKSGVRVSFIGVFRIAPGVFLDEDLGIIVEKLEQIERKKT